MRTSNLSHYGLRSVLVLVAISSSVSGAGPGLITVAGTDWKFPSGPLAAGDAPLGKTGGLAMDRENNLYISDRENRVVVKVTPARTLTVVAGNGQSGFSGDGGQATQAGLTDPQGIAVDSDGNIYIVDAQRIRRVGQDGVISTIAGAGGFGYSGDGGQAVKAMFSSPKGLAVDLNGNLFIADWGNHRVRKITPEGVITTVAGTGKGTFSGDGGPANEAGLNFPSGVALDLGGNLYITDSSNSRVRKVTPAGTISTLAGGGSDRPDEVLARTAGLIGPSGVATDAAGNVYISTAQEYLCKITPSGIIRIIAGSTERTRPSDGTPAQLAPLYGIGAVAVSTAGPIYVADMEHRRIRTIDGNGVITTFAGNGRYSYEGDGGQASQAALVSPSGLAVDAAGNLFIAEGEYRIRRVDRQGVISTIAGADKGNWGDLGPAVDAGLNNISGLAFDAAGNLYVDDAYNQRIRRISQDGTITSVVAPGLVSEGGAISNAVLSIYDGIALDADGNVYYADRFNNRVRKISKDGAVRNIAGTGTRGFAGDGGPADKALVDAPKVIAVDGAGNTYFFDSGNGRIRRIGVEGTITTVAGNGTKGFSGDGGPATEASLGANVSGLAVDSSGTLYISDNSNNRIRTVNPAGTIQTIAGGGTSRDEGAPALESVLASPGMLAVAKDGTVYVALAFGNQVKAIKPAQQ